MTKRDIINKTIEVLDQLPVEKIQEVNDFASFVLKKLEDQTLLHGIQKLVEKSKTYEFLKQEEDLYTAEDLKERYK